MRSDELREEGIAALKARRIDDARRLLAEAIKLNPRDAEAWAYMGVMSTDTNARLMAFRRALEIDSTNKTTLTSLKALGIDPVRLLEDRPGESPAVPPKPTAPAPLPASPFQTENDPRLSTTESDFNSLFGASPEAAAALFGAPPSPTPKPKQPEPAFDDPFGGSGQNPFSATSTGQMPAAPSPTSTGSMPSVTVDPTLGRLRPPKTDQNFDGIPLPTEEYLEQAAAEAEKSAARAPQMRVDGINWVKKDKNRAGERDVWQLRIQAGAAVIAILLVLGTLTVFASRDPRIQQLVGIRTSVPSRTPTRTPSPTPGVTPTPTATLNATEQAGATLTLTLPPLITPQVQQNPNITPIPTGLYAVNLFSLEGVMPRAIATFNAGDAASVLPDFQAEIRLVSVTFNPYPYYYTALSQARTGDFDDAIETLTIAEERVETGLPSNEVPFARALIQSAFADVELLRAQRLRRAGNPSRANESYQIAIERAEAALAADQQNARAHIVVAQVALEQGRYQDAIDLLDFALSPQVGAIQFNSNLDLITLRGSVYLMRAATESGEAAYLDQELADTQGRAAFLANPFDRRGHELRISVALAQGRAGDSVLLNDTYRLYFPNDPRALKLLGDSRQVEGNPDLAFNAYSDAASAALNKVDGGADAAEALVARAELLLARGDGGAALVDLNAAYEAQPDAAIRAKRMEAAYAAGQYDLALDDAKSLVGSEAAPDDVFFLMQARIAYDLAAADSQDALANIADEVLSLLTRTNSALPTALRPIAEEYRARAALVSGDLETASIAANTAFNLSAIPALQILRGDVRAAQGRFDEAREDYLAALNLTDDTDESLALLARAGLEGLPVRLTATAVVVTGTARAVQTSTAEAEFTSAAGTAEVIAMGTATAQASITPTVTLEPSITPTPTATDTETPAPPTPEPTAAPTEG